MPQFEVVYDSEERGVTFATLEEAVQNAYTGMEVWQLADDAIGTRMCLVWPEPSDPTALARAREVEARGNREAVALLGRLEMAVDPLTVQAVSLAWLYGYLVGYGDCADRAQAAFARLGKVIGE
jgi:hypothetical protein